MLAAKQRKTLYKLLDVITLLYAEEIDMGSIDQLEQDLHRVLALFERDFPLSLQVIVFHLLHHLPRYIKLFGPVYSFWMYPYERFNSWISRRVLNRRYPESTVLATYMQAYRMGIFYGGDETTPRRNMRANIVGRFAERGVSRDASKQFQ